MNKQNYIVNGELNKDIEMMLAICNKVFENLDGICINEEEFKYIDEHAINYNAYCLVDKVQNIYDKINNNRRVEYV